MKKKILLTFILILIIILFNSYDIKAKKESDVLINFETTEYEVLNKEILKNLNNYIDLINEEFKTIKTTYSLNIHHDLYEYENYISYVFYIEYYMGGAHPNHKIITINYDKFNNKILDINTLICKNNNILSVFSKISRDELLKSKNVIDTNIMLEGTKENFSNFAFSNEGLIIFFDYYQVAPYSQGEFSIIIPYNKIKL